MKHRASSNRLPYRAALPIALAGLATPACAGSAAPAREPEPLPPVASATGASGAADSPRAYEETPAERAANAAHDAGTDAAARRPGAAIEPMPADLPAVDTASLRGASAHECARGECAIGPDALGPVPGPEPGATTGASGPPPIVAWFQTVRPGAAVRYPRRASVDLLGVVLAGRAALELAEGPRGGGGAQSADAWSAFLLPEGGATIRAEGSEPVTLVLAGAGVVRPGARAERGGRTRGGYAVRRMSELPDLAWARGAFHARIAFEAPASPRASLEVLMGSARAGVPEHDHPSSWEVLVPLVASGRLRVPAQSAAGGSDAGAIGAHERVVSAGHVQYVATAVRHEWVPDGTAPLIAVQLYGPPGPEQRFRALADAGR